MRDAELINEVEKRNNTELSEGAAVFKNQASQMDRREFLGFTLAGLGASLVASSLPSLNVLGQTVRPAKNPVYTQGHYVPQLKESTLTALKVRGAIPPNLAGRYFRNGHNPPPDLIKSFWFGGQGMIHGVRVSGGKAEWYRNRFVQTPALKGKETYGKDGSVDLTASAAATSVYAHAGKIFALQEVNLPFLVSPELETIGVYDFDGALKTVMTAHPKIDRETGEMLFISNSPVPPHLTYHVADKTGKLVHSEVVDGPGTSVIHDIAISKNYVVFFDPSVTLDQKLKVGFPYAWNDKYQAKIGVMPRDRTQGATKWVNVPPFYYFHLANAYEDASGRVVIEGTSYDKAGWDHSAKWINSVADHAQRVVGGSRYTRWTVDPGKGTCEVKYIDDLSLEFPVINYAKTGRQTRYTYAPIFPFGKLKNFAIAKYDDQTGRRTLREFNRAQMPGEVYFVADPQGRAEDDGWIFVYVSDLATRLSELWILDATNLNATPTAVVELGVWVPQGVHGSYISDAELAG